MADDYWDNWVNDQAQNIIFPSRDEDDWDPYQYEIDDEYDDVYCQHTHPIK